MPSSADDSPPVHFSVNGFSKRERSSALRELLGRKLSRVELEPLSDEVRADVTARCVGGIRLITIDHSLMNISRTRELLADGDDALVFHIVGGGCRGSQLGRDIALRPGEAGLLSNGDACSVACFGRTLLLRLAQQELRPLISDFDAALSSRVPADASTLQFLRGYVRLFDELPEAPAQLQHRFVTHVYDLVAMILGPSREAAEQARGRGVRAARLQAIKADVLAHLADHTLSVGTVAARHGISTVYVRKLFEGESLSFSTFVLENRLEAARRMLNDDRFGNRTIGAIAYDAGFGDLSYFNRAFRRRFGASPSDIRAEASRSWNDSEET
jgi:AraC-like DNA-binding protein